MDNETPPTEAPSARVKRRTRKRIAVALIALVLLAAACWGGWRGARLLREHVRFRRLKRYSGLVKRYARANRLPPRLVRAVIMAESSGRPWAVSPVGAEGLMQIMKPAEEDVLRQRRYAKGDLFDPEYNIKIGTAYLRILANRFHDDWWLAIAAYNMGPGAVSRLRGRRRGVPSRELIEKYANPATRAYCRKVLGAS